MPKKRKSSKSIEDKIQQKLKKQFVKSDSHKALKARVAALEKELKKLRKMVDEGKRKASPVTKRRTVKKPASKRAAAPRIKAETDSNLQMIKGIGAVIEKKLHDYGVRSYTQIAAWGSKDIEEFSQRLNFKGRIERERWVEQAKALVAG
ncbi:MAG: hypothetical protein KME56_00410 [Candidatus Thiodiazotropha sp. (ex Ctena orbiculata)]|nr:hypothetical protein [Candidatus Thiodiazotropha taylori]MBT2995083.1 hypothetical protein [Candidatus Thiodiazotropha taylori]MBT2999998.1 hypothetical protein [Candidatus Thiodiazotropha taylori]MBV2105897.1 hypothetical protein [Candidatus Thiodiazotropha taylori]MBV2109686.1 hypothetical protein [Candidatus Thiodiazotropha taylori]